MVIQRQPSIRPRGQQQRGVLGATAPQHRPAAAARLVGHPLRARPRARDDAVGLWGAQLGAPAIWLLPVTFPMVMAVGGFIGLVGIPLPGVEIGIALSALLLGLMVASEAKPSLAIAATIVAFFAIFHGHAHGTELPAGRAEWAGVQHRVCGCDWLSPRQGHRHRPRAHVPRRQDCAPGCWSRRGARGTGVSLEGTRMMVPVTTPRRVPGAARGPRSPGDRRHDLRARGAGLGSCLVGSSRLGANRDACGWQLDRSDRAPEAGLESAGCLRH